MYNSRKQKQNKTINCSLLRYLIFINRHHIKKGLNNIKISYDKFQISQRIERKHVKFNKINKIIIIIKAIHKTTIR